MQKKEWRKLELEDRHLLISNSKVVACILCDANSGIYSAFLFAPWHPADDRRYSDDVGQFIDLDVAKREVELMIEAAMAYGNAAINTCDTHDLVKVLVSRELARRQWHTYAMCPLDVSRIQIVGADLAKELAQEIEYRTIGVVKKLEKEDKAAVKENKV